MASTEGIQTFLFMNIGVTGLWDEDYTLSRIRLCVKPVSREQLLRRSVNLAENVSFFKFEPIDDQYEAMKPLIQYDLIFNEAEIDRLHQYIEAFPKPVTLVSFNGYQQNFPLLLGAVGHLGRQLPEDLRACDLLQAIFEIENHFGPKTPRDDSRMPWEFQRDPEQLPYKFQCVYTRLTNEEYNLTLERPILKSIAERGLPVPHTLMKVECVLAIRDAFLEWVDRGTSTTVFSEGRLPHEVRGRV